jgi:UrcA family protein
MKTFIRSAAVFAAFVSLMLSTEAFNASAQEAARGATPSKTVRFADLDMSKPAGAETLYDRIRSAARFVCRGMTEIDAGKCRANAVEAAVEGVGSPLLTELHVAKTRAET